jgi:hypothetical protein
MASELAIYIKIFSLIKLVSSFRPQEKIRNLVRRWNVYSKGYTSRAATRLRLAPHFVHCINTRIYIYIYIYIYDTSQTPGVYVVGLLYRWYLYIYIYIYIHTHTQTQDKPQRGLCSRRTSARWQCYWNIVWAVGHQDQCMQGSGHLLIYLDFLRLISHRMYGISP